MGLVDVLAGVRSGVLSRFQTPKPLADFRRDRALFLGFRVELLSVTKDTPAFVRKRILERVKAEFFNPARSPMAKMVLWNGFGVTEGWDETLNKYDAALKRALRGDDAARMELGVLESKLGRQASKGGVRTMRQELEKLAVVLRGALAQAAKEADRVASGVRLRLKLYEKARDKIARARALDELMKRTGNAEARAQQMEGVIFLAREKGTIAVARLEMLEPDSELVAKWKKTLNDLNAEVPPAENLDRLEMKIAQRLEVVLHRAEVLAARSFAGRAA